MEKGNFKIYGATYNYTRFQDTCFLYPDGEPTGYTLYIEVNDTYEKALRVTDRYYNENMYMVDGNGDKVFERRNGRTVFQKPVVKPPLTKAQQDRQRANKIRRYEKEIAELMAEVEWRQRYIEKLKAQG